MFAPMGRAQEERWFEDMVKRTDDYLFAIEVQANNQWVHIGNVGLHRIDWRSRSAVFGIAIGDKASWGKGYGTDATRTMLRFAFGELNLHRVELEVFDYNSRAIRAYEKAGFRREGTRRQAHYHDGQYHDAHWMAVLRDEFFGQGEG
jgi:RimJ/RimL family protein N-acetyltransferase